MKARYWPCLAVNRARGSGKMVQRKSDPSTKSHPSNTLHNVHLIPPDRQVLAGLVERVTYQNAENGFCVLRVKARGHRDLVTLVGHPAAISAGEWITATGDWINDRTHGQQFKARFFKTSTPTSNEGIEKYLASGMIRGIARFMPRSFCVPSATRCSMSLRRNLSAYGK
jgi:hypothetical protein